MRDPGESFSGWRRRTHGTRAGIVRVNSILPPKDSTITAPAVDRRLVAKTGALYSAPQDAPAGLPRALTASGAGFFQGRRGNMAASFLASRLDFRSPGAWNWL
jgi:hypothetical protein